MKFLKFSILLCTILFSRVSDTVLKRKSLVFWKYYVVDGKLLVFVRFFDRVLRDHKLEAKRNVKLICVAKVPLLIYALRILLVQSLILFW